MGALTPDELDIQAMTPLWAALRPVVEHKQALMKFLKEELPSAELTPENLTLGLKLCDEFDEIWQHRVPDVWELVQASRAGTLEEKVAEINAEWDASNGHT